MALTEHQELNAVAGTFGVEYRYFSGPPYDLLAKAGIGASLASWTAPDTGQPGSWTEITDRVSFRGRLVQERQGASLVWRAELSGTRYSAALIGLGLSVLCWRRFWRPTGTGTAPAGWQAWEWEFVGEVVGRLDRSDYRPGGKWEREVAGSNRFLSGINAPRLTAGKIPATQGAAASGSVALSQPELERDRGEFVGGTASVALANVVDLNRNTVYISETVPTPGTMPGIPLGWDLVTVPSEIFFKAVAGWPAEKCWWVELANQRTQNPSMANLVLNVGRHSGGVYTTWSVPVKGPPLTAGRYAILCGNRALVESYQGTGNGAAEFIADASLTEPAAWLDPADGFVWCGSGVYARGIAWAPGGAARRYQFGEDVLWDGPTFDSSTIPLGASLVLNYDTGAYTINPMPHPAASANGEGPVIVKVVLADNVCVTLDELTAASTVIRLDNYKGWLTPATGYNRGVVNGCVFRWTGRSGAGLSGVTWENAPGAAIPAATRAYPYVAGLAQTGLPLTATHLFRRKQPAVKSYAVYWSSFEARSYTESGWQADYYAHYHNVEGNIQNLRLTDLCGDASNPYLWVRTVMYLVHAMTDGGRVKINEIETDLAQAALDWSGAPQLDGARSAALAAYLCATWAGLPAADFVDGADPLGHQMGQHALAITPVVKVLDDLAQATGCLVRYSLRGAVRWLTDPWWPLVSVAPVAECALGATTIRGEVEVTAQPAEAEYIILNALSLEGDAHPLRYVYPRPYGTTEPPVQALVTEVNGKVVARDVFASAVAQREYERLLLAGKACSVTLKGPGEWARPSQLVTLTWDLDGDGVAETSTWIIEGVTTAREVEGRTRRLRTTLRLAAFGS